VTFGWQEEFLREERRMREKISSESEEWDLEPSIPMKKRRGEERRAALLHLLRGSNAGQHDTVLREVIDVQVDTMRCDAI
jgi:hypothetical protein